MRVLQINIFGNLSTGKIAVDIARTLKEGGHESAIAYARNTVPDDIIGIRIGNSLDVCKHVLMTRITDQVGFYSKRATKELIKNIDEYHPDVIHLHNLHGYYINIEILFRYLASQNIPVVWTLHDCWAFTGHCTHFLLSGCDKWKEGCYSCPTKKSYPASFILDRSRWNYQKKKELFCSVKNMTLVTPSVWLQELTEQSFLSNYKVLTIHNGIDLSVFRPSHSPELRVKYNIHEKKIVLGVAGTWSLRKGIKDLVQLSHLLPDDYQVVIVGVSKKQKKNLPSSMIGIERTYDARELASIYSDAFCFVNPTYEDTFSMVNIESLACGTPVITYRTGGCPENINDSCGLVVEQGDVEGLKDAVMSISVDRAACVKQAQKFDRVDCFRKYADLYQQLIQ